MIILKIRDYTITPGPRYKRLGDFSGEEYREKFVIPALTKAKETGEKLFIDLDGTLYYSAAWLMEVFGILPAVLESTPKAILDTITFISPARTWLISEIHEYIKIGNFKQ